MVERKMGAQQSGSQANNIEQNIELKNDAQILFEKQALPTHMILLGTHMPLELIQHIFSFLSPFFFVSKLFLVSKSMRFFAQQAFLETIFI